jgi:hypothetical protein
MSEALNKQGLLEEQTSALEKALLAEHDPVKRQRLVFDMSNVVGERLAPEQDHAEEFRIVDAAAVQADVEF